MGCNGSKKQDIERDRERRSVPPSSSSSSSSSSNAGSSSSPYSDVPRSQYRDIHNNAAAKINEGTGTGAGAGIGGAIGGGGAGAEGGVYGTSYTNRKTKEYDLLQDIVKQTRHNFIDVSAAGRGGNNNNIGGGNNNNNGGIGGGNSEDLNEREDRYNKQLAGITAFSPSNNNNISGGGSLLSTPLLTLFPPSNPSNISSIPKINENNDDPSLLLSLLNDASIPSNHHTIIINASAIIHDAINNTKSSIIQHQKRLVLSFEDL